MYEGVPSELTASRIRIRGTVQGVGFRPHVFRVAKELGLKGWVINDSEGVLIHCETRDTSELMTRLRLDAPTLARIDDATVEPAPKEHFAGFEIRSSEDNQQAATRVSPDAAVCSDCLDDICDPTNRRAGYAFTNCTHCGPRYSITRKIPYDRANTSMGGFQMCPDCLAEYENPLDRRFHAQPNACPTCGPKLSHSVAEILSVLRAGGCIAVKGLGGYHLMADARQETAVRRVRDIKKRDHKPFAVMVPGLAAAQAIAHIDSDESRLLSDHRRSVVVLREKSGADLAESVSLELGTIGVMLPYTPFQYLLFHEAAGRPAGTDWIDLYSEMVLVATSANLAGEPLITDDAAAIQAFEGHVDLIVTHDRDIETRLDDSVARIVDGAPRLLRRARGWAPDPIKLPFNGPTALALGADLKNTVCVTRGAEAFLSQHIGGLDNLATQDFQLETIEHMLDILDVSPELVVTDLHPDMNQAALARFSDKPVLRVQHHHAHIASAMAEHGLSGPVLGLALDGYGLGLDGTSSWGGELLSVSSEGMSHVAGLKPIKAPGGDAAARSPWRMGISLLEHAVPGRDHPLMEREEADLVRTMLRRGVNSPKTSSAGRLFDAFASLIGIQHENRFEGEAAMRMEALVSQPIVRLDGYEILPCGALSLMPLVSHMFDIGAAHGADLFHGTFAKALAAWVLHHAEERTYCGPVVLSGGCFQNRPLSELTAQNLRTAGFEPIFNEAVPANDGGLSLGQAWIAQLFLTRTGG